MIEFPKWKYSKTDAVIVQNPDEEKKLGKGWRDTPFVEWMVPSPAAPTEEKK